MTTIAYRGGVIASDSCWALEEMQVCSVTKIMRLRGGALFGASGDFDIRAVQRLLEDVRDEARLPTTEQLRDAQCHMAGLLILPGGTGFQMDVEQDEDNPDVFRAQLWPITQEFAAIGSGKKMAMAAMMADATAVRAVEIACALDINSRVPVHSLKL